MKIFEKTPYYENEKGFEPNIEPFLLESLIEDLIYELQDGYDLHFDYVIECGRILLIPLI